LDLNEFSRYKIEDMTRVNLNLLKLTGVNQNFLKLQDGKLKFSQITGGEIFHEGLKLKNLQIKRMKFKKIFYRGENQK